MTRLAMMKDTPPITGADPLIESSDTRDCVAGLIDGLTEVLSNPDTRPRSERPDLAGPFLQAIAPER